LRFAKDRGEVIASDPAMEAEVNRLRAQVGELMKKVADTEDAKSRAQADVAALRAGVEPDALKDPLADGAPEAGAEEAPGAGPDPFATAPTFGDLHEVAEEGEAPNSNGAADEPSAPAEEPESAATAAQSLRARLAGAAASKKGKPKDVSEWK